MKARAQLCLANTLMTVGVLPWALILVWVAAFFIDPLGMIGLMGMSFLFGLCVAGPGAVWSWLLTRDAEEGGSRKAPLFRSLVLLALLGPVLVLFLMSTFRIR
ncbi:hypothetical protein AB595_04045 [Massilia sp. WF1]|uniref:hypothetical protein n=1 Tax=unclassified Massilia TaxID=2609279 RepID=UPI000649DD0C|nr:MULTISPECIES: hypothetical protein [unclassified Massilia]ALK96870.1 hypothetical protein AM586_11925 [Massilia sp. WG5]KLU38212.1 hypothetical protein AB595_04045 [Massilia sp. WF1]